jgi:hypothetical protein
LKYPTSKSIFKTPAIKIKTIDLWVKSLPVIEFIEQNNSPYKMLDEYSEHLL